ncbi:MAG: DUF4382 domain-containing protein [Myxococcales bacterium]|nr:DUF4382 domain-containing protein [Myxococcales bacterium]
MNRITLLLGAASAFALAVAVACGGSTPEGPPPGMGRLAVELVDAPTQQLKAINVTISQVTAHSAEKGWVEIFNGKLTVDLLKLKEYALPLGFKDLPPGKITQIRLITAAGGTQEVVLPGGEHLALMVPSGLQSGIKIKGPFGIQACNTTTVTLDFDGHKSIWVHPTGQGEEWILRPVIHTRKAGTASTPCQNPGGTGGGSGTGGPGEGSGTGGTGGTGTGGTSGGGVLEGSGGACTSGTGCLSGVCVGGRCSQGGPGVPCRLSTDCVSGVCQADGLCSPGSAGGTGTSCVSNSDCLSNTCAGGVCESGNQGAPCRGQGDCTAGFSCEAGSCQPVVN